MRVAGGALDAGRLLFQPDLEVAAPLPNGRADQSLCPVAPTSATQASRRQDGKAQDVTGFNVGINSGESAGQTIFHCHVHLIPRRPGDVEEPRGGVRGVIPGRAHYKA
ncbi:MAG: HIT domain-containing protein [Acidobacteria bacterium]|nr:HIT domain-containing protein [Acidobacteriota bacterium]